MISVTSIKRCFRKCIRLFGLTIVLSAIIFSCQRSEVNSRNLKYTAIEAELVAQMNELQRIYHTRGYEYVVFFSDSVVAMGDNGSMPSDDDIYRCPALMLIQNTRTIEHLVSKDKISPYASLKEYGLNVERYMSIPTVDNLIWGYPGSLHYGSGRSDSLMIITSSFLKWMKLDRQNNDKIAKTYWMDFMRSMGSKWKRFNEKMIAIPNPFFKYVSYFMGFNVQNIEGGRVFWAYGHYEADHLLLAYFEDYNTSIILRVHSPLMPSPLTANESNLLRSPLGTAIVRAMSINIQESSGNKIFRELQYYELINLYSYQSAANYFVADSLAEVFMDLFPNEPSIRLLATKAVASHQRVGNLYSSRTIFKIATDTTIRILARGACIYREQTAMLDYENDNIQVYFDLNADKADNFDIYAGDRQYIFTYGLNSIAGNFISKKGIQMAFFEPSDTMYVLEVAFPWNTLDGYKPTKDQQFGFDIQVNDNDGSGYEGAIAWHSPPDETHRSTVNYGTLKLNGTFFGERSVYGAGFTEKPPVIDGRYDAVWDNSEQAPFKYALSRGGKTDLSATFRALWDQSYFYLLVEIIDDFKNQPWTLNALRDKGWIEGNNGKIVWEMSPANIIRHPSDNTVFNIDEQLYLRAGEYILHFETDYSSIPERMSTPAFTSFFNGIKIH